MGRPRRRAWCPPAARCHRLGRPAATQRTIPRAEESLVEVTIRPFRPEDLDGLFVLDYRCYAPPYRFGYQQLLLTLQQVDLTALVVEGERKGEIVGGLIVRAERAARQAAIVSLMIEPDHRRLGLGARLVQWVADYARKSGWQAVVVPLERGNEAATAFLAAQGFADTGTGGPWFAAPDVGTLWRLSLDEAGASQP